MEKMTLKTIYGHFSFGLRSWRYCIYCLIGC
uniref:Uncharacterized protein n=1 Tax=Rhizophora mucronata TaxID=61149 RepID=A0A2P2J3H2_RHIMU